MALKLSASDSAVLSLTTTELLLLWFIQATFIQSESLQSYSMSIYDVY